MSALLTDSTVYPESPFWFKNGSHHTPISLFADSVKNCRAEGTHGISRLRRDHQRHWKALRERIHSYCIRSNSARSGSTKDIVWLAAKGRRRGKGLQEQERPLREPGRASEGAPSPRLDFRALFFGGQR